MPTRQASQHTLLQRGDAKVKKPKDIVVPNIIKTMMVGNTTIHFADNAIPKDPEEHEEVLQNFFATAWRIYLKNHEED